MAGHYENTVENLVTGKPVNGATVLIYQDGATIATASVEGEVVLGNEVTSGTLATIFSDDGVTQINQSTNPLTTGATGSFDFYTDDPRVIIAILFNGAPLEVWNDVDIPGNGGQASVTALAVRVSATESIIGLASPSTDLGTFTGTTITDNTNIVTALQELETAAENGASGDITSSGLTMSTDRILGRTTASSGAIEELTVGSGLTLSAGSLSATATSVAEASAAEIWTGTETAKFLSPDKLFDSAAPQTLTTSSNATAVNMGAGINFNLSLTEDSQISNPTNAKPGQSGRIRITDDGTGGWDLTWAANWTFVGSTPAITTSASDEHLFAYFVNGASDIEVSYLGVLA